MEFEALLDLVGDDPLFESSLLLSGDVNPNQVRVQLARWVNTGRIYQLRRGLYALAPPYQKIKPHPFFIANHLQRASYISLQSALAYYGLIPDVVNMTTSVTTGRPERLETPLGVFAYHHMKTSLLFGYEKRQLDGQNVRLASPEKALLDLAYLQTVPSPAEFLEGLRLQNTARLDKDVLTKYAEKFAMPKMRTVAAETIRVMTSESGQFEDL